MRRLARAEFVRMEGERREAEHRIADAEEARERTVGTTRRFVRRQRSWFRRDATTTWLDAARSDLLDAAAEVIDDRTIAG